MRYLYILIIASSVTVLHASAGIVEFKPGPYVGKDTFVSSGSPNTNYGYMEYMYVGNIGGTILQSLIQFTQLDGYIDTPVNSAILHLYFEVSVQITGCTLYMDRITEDWIEKDDGGVTWNTKPGVAGAPESYEYPTYTYRVWEEFDVTGFVSDWLDGVYDNYGWLIYTTDNRQHNADAATSEFTEPNFRPKLVVDFDSPVESSSLGEIKAAFK
ncbi:MAG: DNRLRE domain-containing protein [bacterium]|nr:DNRLRE domain-containing protein [bacterium]